MNLKIFNTFQNNTCYRMSSPSPLTPASYLIVTFFFLFFLQRIDSFIHPKTLSGFFFPIFHLRLDAGG